MKKIILTMIMVLLLVAAVGCTTNNNTSTSSKSTPFIGGTTGLNIQFYQSSPPPEVYDGGDYPFQAVIKLENKGETDVKKENIIVKIAGIRAEEFGSSEGSLTKSPDQDVLATVKDPEGNIRNGAPVFVEFNGLNHKDPLAGNTPFTFMADVCYVYETTANAKVCVRENNVDDRKASGVCKVEEKKMIYNSGAPVQVISFLESARATDKIAFTFDILHRGTGKIFKADTKCDTSQITNEDKIWVEVTSDAGGNLECSNLNSGTGTSGYASLYGDTTTITCTLQKATTNDFETPITIKVKYDYR
jgi:hypothetical protein